MFCARCGVCCCDLLAQTLVATTHLFSGLVFFCFCVQVEEVVQDGPSYLSGKVKPSDIVKAVDSVRVGSRHGYALDNVKKLVLGKPDTPVTLRILRNQQEFDVIITRAHPRTSSTSSHASLVGVAKSLPMVAAPDPFASPHGDVEKQRRLVQADSMPVQTPANDQGVRHSGGHFAAQLEYQVGT